MPWTTPATFTAGQIIGASDLNTQLRDNLNFLNSGRGYASAYQATGTDYSLSVATTWTSIDTANLALTFTTQSGRVWLEAAFELDQSAGASDVSFDWLNNNTSVRSANNNVGTARAVVGGAFSTGVVGNWKVPALFTGLTPGTLYTFYLQYYKNSGTVSLRRNTYPTLCYGTEF
jgi:hypothetical protein